MKKIPRITEIIKAEPFKVTVRWTTGEIRVIDFEELFNQWGTTADDLEGSLLTAQSFKLVRLSEDKTLEWPILVKHLAFEGNVAIEKSSPLSFDPVVLYEASHSIEKYRLVPVM